MSDGPHTSLNMHRSWKRLAEYADNKAHSIDDVAGAFIPALAQTCDTEAPPSFMKALVQVFSRPQEDLFRNQKAHEIAALRRDAAGYPLANAIIDAAERRAAKGEHGSTALLGAVTDGLIIRAASANRSVEEHYYRESTAPRSVHVRDRLQGALAKAALSSFAAHRLNMDGASKPSRISKQSGLDDGVSLE
jgi:hypothetical protein